jgi:acyl-CoA synthetase (AMP-forming)/AMP-acid ligase II
MFKERPDTDIAIVSSGKSYSVGQIIEWSSEASALITKHLSDILNQRNDNDRACLLLPSTNPVDYLVGLMACLKAGVSVVPWREDTLPLEVVCDSVRPDAVLRLSHENIASCSIEAVRSPKFEGQRIGEVIMLTSGSTGAPKGVALDFDQIALNNLAAGAAIEVWRCSAWSIDINMALMSATCHMIMAWQFGLPLHHLAGCTNDQLDELYSSGKVGFGGSPLQLIKLHDRLSDDVSPHTLVSSGDFLTPQMIDQLKLLFPQARINKLYGLTELGGRFCCMPHDYLMHNKEAAGFPLTGFSARIKTDTIDEERGEVEAKTPCLAHGYYLPGGKFSRFDDRWFATGDIGNISVDGVVTIRGRADDVFKVGGEKVDRQTIEAALSQVLTNHEYVVLAVEHKILGQCAALFIGNDSEVKMPKWADIIRHLKTTLPTRFIPALMYQLPSELPRLANGKIDRTELRLSHLSYTRLS